MTKFLTIALPIVTALIICGGIITVWIKVCSKWKLFDLPDARKHHLRIVPSMGGIGIFAGVIITFLLFANYNGILFSPYLLCSSLILFFTGFFDDLLDIAALKKLFIQLIAAFIIVAGGVRLNGFYGLFGIGEIALVNQYIISIFVIVFFTNAFNFIDGVDGLAGSIGLIISSSFGIIFFQLGQLDYAILAFCLSGALAGFLFFNFDPARIFMGDTGSLVTGFLLSVLGIQTLNIQSNPVAGTMDVAPALVFAIMFVPVFDICRVFFIRVFTGSSPFKADRSHLHHMILRQQFGHRGVTIMISVFNLMIIFLQIFTKQNSINKFILISSALAIFIVNSKVISLIAAVRNKIIGEPKRALRVEKPTA